MLKVRIEGSITVKTAFIIAVPVLASLIGGVAALIGALAGLLVGALVTAVSVMLLLIIDLAIRQKESGERKTDQMPKTDSIPADRVDALTGLANENGLKAWFAEKTGRIAEDKKAIMVISADLANYTQLVAERGQEQADAILKEVARRIASFTGEEGIAARTGSDEFAVIATILPTKSLELVSDIAGKLTEMLQRPIEMSNGVVWIGGSVGAAMGKPSESKETLERARSSLKKSKQLGAGHFYVDGLSKD